MALFVFPEDITLKVKFTSESGLRTKRVVTLQVTSQELIEALQRTYTCAEINVEKPHVIYRLEVS